MIQILPVRFIESIWYSRCNPQDLLDPENPSPARVVSEETANHGAQDPGESNHHAHQGSNVLSQVCWAHFGKHNHSEGVEAYLSSAHHRQGPRVPKPTRSANSLKNTKGNQLVQVLRKPASKREGEKQDISGYEGISPPDNIGQARKDHSAPKIC